MMKDGEDHRQPLKTSLPSNELLRGLAALKARLNEPGVWPESADRLLEHLLRPTAPSDPWTREKEEEMISLLVQEALDGEDIGLRYPSFFKRLMGDEELHEAFLDALDVLQKSRNGELERLPEAASQDLSFLAAAVVRPHVEESQAGRWRVLWQQTAEQLQRLFDVSSLVLGPARGAPMDWLEDSYLTLLRSEVLTPDARLDVMFDATQTEQEPDQLLLAVTVISLAAAHPTPGARPMRASLAWGDYDETVAVDQNGRAVFPPLPLAAILSETDHSTLAGLRLTLEPDLS